MRLLYLWLENYNNIQNQGFNFSPDFHIEYKKETNQLEIAKKEKTLPDNFFGEKVSSVTAIVGKNGTGKSSILAAICYFLANTVGKPLDNEIQNRIVLCFLKGENTISCFDGVIQNDSCYPHKAGTKILTCGSHSYEIEYIAKPEENAESNKSEEIAEPNKSEEIAKPNKSEELEEFKKNLLGLLYAVQTTIEYLNVAEKSMLFLTEQGLIIKHQISEPFQRANIFYENKKKSIENKMLFNFWLKMVKYPKNEDKKQTLWPKKEDNDNELLEYTPIIQLNVVPAGINSYYNETNVKVKILKYFIIAFDEYFQKHLGYSTENEASKKLRSEAQELLKKNNIAKEDIQNILQKISTIERSYTTEITPDKQQQIISRTIDIVQKQFIDFFEKLMKFINKNPSFENLNPDGRGRIFLDNKFLNDEDTAQCFLDLLRETETFLPNFFVIEPKEKYSSGQLVMLNMLSRLYWQADVEKLKEKTHILLMIDEGEITLHPEWQRNYFSRLLEVCELLNANVQLILTTHSPFLLSDIPKENVIFLLDKNDKQHELEHTFAANIHTMLSSSFFMNGVIGDFAKEKIQKVIKRLSLEKNEEKMDLADCKRIIDLIAEPILRNKLNEMYRIKLQAEQPDQLIEQLEKQIAELKKRQKDKFNDNNPK